MGNKIGIVSDDLTGANDSGVQLAKKHLSSTVVFDYKKSTVHTKPDVLIVDTDSRAKRESDAYIAAYQAASFLKKEGYQHLYKKVDSTLRGNISAELSAIEQVYQPEMVVIAPAYPKMNRQTIHGHHYVNGVLITETEFSKDPKTPVTESFIPELLKQYRERGIGLIDKVYLNKSIVEVIQTVNTFLEKGVTWFVCDGETEADLQKVTEVFSKMNKRTVWAGSAGLIEYLPESLKLTPSNAENSHGIKIDKTLVVSGSLSQVTKQQLVIVEDLANSFFIEVDPVELVKQTFKVESFVEELKRNYQHDYFVLYVEASEGNRLSAKEAGEELGLTLTEVSEFISKGLGKIAKRLLESCSSIHGMVLTGGDTAKAVCSEIEITEMELYAEVEPGLPFGRVSSEQHSYWAVTKAGGFGHEQSLVNVVEYMANIEG
ncbi:MAG: four-carbon acid sugar kinase family protein [Bacillota bacterium]